MGGEPAKVQPGIHERRLAHWFEEERRLGLSGLMLSWRMGASSGTGGRMAASRLGWFSRRVLEDEDADDEDDERPLPLSENDRRPFLVGSECRLPPVLEFGGN